MIRRILIGRTDAIGDVVLTLPLAGLLRQQYPEAEIFFLGSHYTEDIVRACEHIDHFLNWTELLELSDAEAATRIRNCEIDLVLHVFPVRRVAKLCKKAGIGLRVGTRNRWYHWLTCNRLPQLSRRESGLHEAQLNIQLAVRAGVLAGAVGNDVAELTNYYGLNVVPYWPSELSGLVAESVSAGVAAVRKKVILHVGSRLSARNWPVEHFVQLAKKVRDSGGMVFLTGTAAEGANFRDYFFSIDNSGATPDVTATSDVAATPDVTATPWLYDLTGKLSLQQLFGFIKNCDVLVAASTGPLHMAAAVGIRAIGVYPPIAPIHPARWAPIGKNAVALSRSDTDKSFLNCRRCVGDKSFCACMNEVTPERVWSLV